MPALLVESDYYLMDQGTFTQNAASYRDPSGFVFTYNGEIYRQVNKVYKKDFELFIGSGLYKELSEKGLFIKHEQIDQNFTDQEEWYTTLRPERLDYISYPYEWCFDQLKDAALLTLQIAQLGIEHGMILKDATPHNVQLHKGKVVFIDSLSFEEYNETQPWIAYRQFCESFLVPLALMHYLQKPLQPLLQSYPEGISLDMASSLLPWKSKLNLHTYLHIHLQDMLAAKKTQHRKEVLFSKQKLLNLFRSLKSAIESFKLGSKGVWSDYYNEAQERDGYLAVKKEIVSTWINHLTGISTAIDLGANDGTFSEMLLNKANNVISVDGDHFAINKLYKSISESNRNINPLVMNLANPSPSFGFYNLERKSFIERTKGDVVLALALIHHLAIGQNIPFDSLARFFRELGKTLIIEFVPKYDPKVKLMLVHRKDVFPWYIEDNFIKEFTKYYKCKETNKIANSGRTLYFLETL